MKLTINERTTLSLNRFTYERMSKDGDHDWESVTDYQRMYRVLRKAYHVDPNLIIRQMQTGHEVQTMFTWFRAIPVDAEPA